MQFCSHRNRVTSGFACILDGSWVTDEFSKLGHSCSDWGFSDIAGSSGCTMSLRQDAESLVEQDPALIVGQVPGWVFKGRTEDDIHAIEGLKLRNDRTFKRIANLLLIKQNTVYSVALDDWQQTAKLLSERVDRMEKRSGDLKNEIYQLVGFFSVFQGVVLTAVTQLAQSSDEYHNCKKVWSPVILTALAWVVATVGVWQKMSRIQMLDDQCKDEDETRRVLIFE